MGYTCITILKNCYLSEIQMHWSIQNFCLVDLTSLHTSLSGLLHNPCLLISPIPTAHKCKEGREVSTSSLSFSSL